jgi:hypothetical protein
MRNMVEKVVQRYKKEGKTVSDTISFITEAKPLIS